MTLCHAPICLGVLTGLSLVFGAGGQPLVVAAAVNGSGEAAKSFEQHCVKCHGKDGTGKAAHRLFPEIPNFTASTWQAQRNDAQLLASILEGKGPDMPAWRGKINAREARDLIARIRAFAPTKGVPGKEKEKKSAPNGTVEEQFRRLEAKMSDLRKKFRQLSKPSPSGTSSQPSPTTAADVSATESLFQQHCTKCHAADGTGKTTRRRLARIPNFSAASWQAQRSDAQLLASILDGKGPKMPAWRGKISEQQARSLVARVRAFASPADRSGQELDEPAPPGPSEAEPVSCFIEQLTHWLGNFHPATVHFPIALLTAAAIAELILMVRSKPEFAIVARFCLWLGTLTALVAAILGWFLVGFPAGDDSWVLTTHRWLGTATVIGAGSGVVLMEVSQRPGRLRTRTWYRAALLVMVALVLLTGFLGGVVVFGFDHYSWPP
jgi:mono/diheme cytochrome c family protein/uncharacterized membrane protein